jgi:membrane protease subunit HflK
MRARRHRPHTPGDAHGRHRGPSWGLLAMLALGCALLGWLATGVYSVGHNERAVVRRCGRALDELRGPGLHVGLPYGIDRVTRLKALETKRTAVGMALGERALGRRIEPQQAETLTGDRNLIVVSAVVHYTIRYDPNDDDPVAKLRAYLFHAADVPGLVRGAAGAALTSVIATMPVDDVLTTGRETIRAEVRRRTQRRLDRYGLAVDVTDVLLEDLAPPQEVADAFRDVITARADRDRAINEAEGYRNRVLPQARGEAKRTRTEAEAYADEVVKKARGDAQRFEKIAAVAATSRDLTSRRLILEAMEEVLPRLRKVIIDGKARTGLDLGLIETDE